MRGGVGTASPAAHNWGNYHGTGEIVPFVDCTFERGVVIGNSFVRSEYCASPLCPLDLLLSPKFEENCCGAKYPAPNHPYPAAPAVRRKPFRSRRMYYAPWQRQWLWHWLLR